MIELVLCNCQKWDLPHLLNCFSCAGSYVCLLSCFILFIYQKSVWVFVWASREVVLLIQQLSPLLLSMLSASTNVQRSRGGRWDAWEEGNEGREDGTATWSGSDLVAGSVQLGCLTESAKCLILILVVDGDFWFKYSPAFNYFLNPVHTFQLKVEICKKKKKQHIMFKVAALHVATWIILS